MHLDFINTIINDGSKYIVATFNINTWKTINIVCVYRVQSCFVVTILNKLQTLFNILPNIVQSS
jgi:hypothetical protein